MSELINVFDNVVEVFIEISKGSNIKYEFDKKKNLLVCDRILYTPFRYIFNYGFIPETLSPDSDPIDAVVIMDDTLVPGCVIRCKIIGCLETSDSEGIDPKLILCPIDKIDPKSKEINDIDNLSSFILDQIKYFFTHYKDLENKHVEIGKFLSKDEAIRIYIESIESYKKNVRL
jgi:inorganic pyrophosphatase